MSSKLALLSNLLLASAALLDTSLQLEARPDKNDQLQAIQPAEFPGDVVSRRTLVGPASVDNLGGATWQGNFTAVTGTFNVPEVPVPSQQSGQFGVDILVSMSNNVQCNGNVSFQAGVSITALDGVASYIPWCKWLPSDFACNFTGLDIQAGNDVNLTLITTSPTIGVVTIQSGDQTYMEVLDAIPSFAFCGEVVEIAIAAMVDGNGVLVPLVDFGTLVFQDAIASGLDGSHNPGDASFINLVQSNMFTQFSAIGSNLSIEYVSRDSSNSGRK